MRFGVVLPSRLAPRPGGRVLREHGPELWLDGALATVRGQTCFSGAFTTYVGVSPGAVVPPHVHDHARVLWAKTPGQAAAVNVAADEAARYSDVLLFLEDDDLWLPRKTAAQLPYLGEAPFVSCSQRLLSEEGDVVGTNDYPVPSGWMMGASLWKRVGRFDEGTKWLVDSEWLGRLGKTKTRRLHLVPSGDTHSPNKLGYVSRRSEVVKCGEHAFLVDRTLNTGGGMATITSDVVAAAEADREAEKIRGACGCDPW